MGFLVANGAMLKCSFGNVPSSMMVLPESRVLSTSPAATIMDYKPLVNILPFGMCMSLANPTVASATAAALGVLTPMPCIPNTTAPWLPGCQNVIIGGKPALNHSSKLMCMWGGIIQVAQPGQMKTMIP
ncbi:MAG: DUF4280 domain-containing protein [Marinisporobacter sp.]|jgi:hypothetical protein|nr:DUF4280 domain-containing protein [Marinisporobacter sp.]